MKLNFLNGLKLKILNFQDIKNEKLHTKTSKSRIAFTH
jgi:hypothetical protein